MSEKYTPGPWRVFTNPDGTKIVGIGDQNGEGVTDCGFGIWRGGNEEALANARLIAAAPDLFQALQIVRMSAGWWTMSDETRTLVSEALDKALAAQPVEA